MKKTVAAVFAAVIALSASCFAVSAAQTDGDPATVGIGEQAQEAFPKVSGIYNTADGTTVSWKAYPNAARYGLFVLENDSWKGVGTTSGLSLTHKGLKDGQVYRYTVRAIGSDGEFCSGFNRDGYENTFIAPPEITAISNSEKGVSVKWTERKSAESYRVYRKTDSTGWRRLADTADAEYTDADAASGTKYTYTVRAVTADGSTLTSYYTAGKSLTYIKAPYISGFYNSADSMEIKWSKCGGAAKYRVFVLENGSWKGLGNTASNSFVNKNVKSGETYTYTVRCLDSKGNYISAYRKEGKSFIFIAPPVVSVVSAAENGVAVKWSADNNAVNFRVYRKTDSTGWSKLADTAEREYTDASAASGAKYYYTVRAITADGSDWTSYYTSGKSLLFVKAPRINSFENTADGAKLGWGKCGGAYKYGVFFLDGENGWKGLGTTKEAYYIDKTVKNGEKRTYTVRCLDSNGKFISAFIKTGKENRYFAPPAISNVSPAAKGNTVEWNAVDGAAGFRLYRRTVTSGWARLFDSVSSTSYNDTSAEKNNAYAYTLRLVNEKGALISSYSDDAKFYYNGVLANGSLSINGKSYVFVDGKVRQGYVKIGGATYYYNSDGVMLKDCLVGSSSEGFRYADKNGKIDFNFTGITKNAYGSWYLENGKLDLTLRTAVNYGGAKWNVLDGKAYKATSEHDKTFHLALALVDKVCSRSMSKSEKLWKMFRYIQNAYTEKNPRIPHFHGDGWEILYANDMLVYGTGNCMSYGAEFAFIAKAIGYNECYACNSGGHGWAEVEGKVYDPEWGRHFFDNTYFGIDYYNNPTKVVYTVIKGGAAWMHVKV